MNREIFRHFDKLACEANEYPEMMCSSRAISLANKINSNSKIRKAKVIKMLPRYPNDICKHLRPKKYEHLYQGKGLLWFRHYVVEYFDLIWDPAFGKPSNMNDYLSEAYNQDRNEILVTDLKSDVDEDIIMHLI